MDIVELQSKGQQITSSKNLEYVSLSFWECYFQTVPIQFLFNSLTRFAVFNSFAFHASVVPVNGDVNIVP